MKKLLWFLIIFIGIGAYGQTEIPLGTWRTHLNYTRAIAVAAAGEKIFCATDASLFYYDTEDGSVNKMSKIDGLSALNVSALAFDPESGYLVVGYEDGNLDLIRENSVYNINTIRNENIDASKTINNIAFREGFAYVAADFGVPVIDLEKREIRETYLPGDNGSFLRIAGCAIRDDSIFIATAEGVKAGKLAENINLIDFRNWETFDSSRGIPVQAYRAIAAIGGAVYAAAQDSVYFYASGNWAPLHPGQDSPPLNLNVAGNTLLISMAGGILQLTAPDVRDFIEHPLIEDPRAATLHDGALWVADHENGLVTNVDGGFASVHPSGPAANQIGKLLTAGDSLVALPFVSEEDIPENTGFFVFQNGEWRSYPASAETEFTDVAARSADNALYFASGDGLHWWRDGVLSAVNDALAGQHISSVAVDENQSLWLSAYSENTPLYSLSPQGELTAHQLPDEDGRYIRKILPYPNGDKWLAIDSEAGGGILVYNEQSGAYRRLTAEAGAGGLPSAAINDMSVDREGYVWVVTDGGVVYFANPFSILSLQSVDAFFPIYNQSRLLEGESLTAIAIDGGNRKWLGSRNGLYLFSETGDRLFHHFTAENSPALSDVIRDIAVIGRTGEVFIATDNGLISFRSEATEGAAAHQNVRIFPNPVPPDFNGLVGISGLAENANIKITDISGKLVWETRAYGGGASWNVMDYRGKRAATGIYLVFSSDSEGEETFVGKIAVVN